MAMEAAAAGVGLRTERERLRAIQLTAIASLIGTTIEWYDFILYTSLSGLIFNKLFFPADDPVVSLMLAYATFAVGFVTRPIGGAFFGHFGDRIGRKPLLVLTLTMMGVATFLIGLVPTYASIGIAAPLIVIALRLIQGFAMGGEWGGAVLMAFEYAPPEKRGFYACFPQIGFALGLCLSTGAITLLSSALSNDAFMSWGWRCAFLVSVVLLGSVCSSASRWSKRRSSPASGTGIGSANFPSSTSPATTGGTSFSAGWRAWAKALSSRSIRFTCSRI